MIEIWVKIFRWIRGWFIRDKEDLGPCCACGRPHDATVRTIVMLDFQGPSGFNGWGCLVCHLPQIGAMAILCDECITANRQPVTICAGTYITDRKRMSLDESYPRKVFLHDDTQHVGVDIFMPSEGNAIHED